MSFIFRSTDDPLQPVDIMLAIFDYLYPDTNPLPIPDVTDPLFVYKFSPSVFWIHLYLKMLDHSEQVVYIPYVARKQIQWNLGITTTLVTEEFP